MQAAILSKTKHSTPYASTDRDEAVEVKQNDISANVTIESDHKSAITATDLLKNVNLNITVNCGCNATHIEGSQNSVSYVTKRPLNLTRSKQKYQRVLSEWTAKLHVSALDDLEFPALFSSLSSELNQLYREISEIQATIDKLKYGNLETDDFYIFD